MARDKIKIINISPIYDVPTQKITITFSDASTYTVTVSRNNDQDIPNSKLTLLTYKIRRLLKNATLE